MASTLNIDIYQLVYEYTLVDSPQNTLLLSTGLHTMQMYIQFLGNLKHQVDGDPDLTEALNEAEVVERIMAPVPNLGFSTATILAKTGTSMPTTSGFEWCSTNSKAAYLLAVSA